jgi:large subunit ribosomal protein L10e
MRGAYGKPYGLAARVDIGQVMISIRCKEANSNTAKTALRRAMYDSLFYKNIVVVKTRRSLTIQH